MKYFLSYSITKSEAKISGAYVFLDKTKSLNYTNSKKYFYLLKQILQINRKFKYKYNTNYYTHISIKEE